MGGGDCDRLGVAGTGWDFKVLWKGVPTEILKRWRKSDLREERGCQSNWENATRRGALMTSVLVSSGILVGQICEEVGDTKLQQ